jgi:hypothetical protein
MELAPLKPTTAFDTLVATIVRPVHIPQEETQAPVQAVAEN